MESFCFTCNNDPTIIYTGYIDTSQPSQIKIIYADNNDVQHTTIINTISALLSITNNQWQIIQKQPKQFMQDNVYRESIPDWTNLEFNTYEDDASFQRRINDKIDKLVSNGADMSSIKVEYFGKNHARITYFI